MTTVFVWTNVNMLFSKVRKGHQTIGHASMNIADQYTDIRANNETDYVSWWPTHTEDENTKGGYRIGRSTPNFFDDLMSEQGYVPDYIIRLTGMDVEKTRGAWNEIRTKAKAHYRFKVKNCSTIVARVLRAGSKSGSGWKRHCSIWAPSRVKQLAISMGGEYITWQAFLGELETAGVISGEEHGDLAKLKKRDGAHGNSTNQARLSNGGDTGASGMMLHGFTIGNYVIEERPVGHTLTEQELEGLDPIVIETLRDQGLL